MKIFVIGALPASLINFRGELLQAFVSKGADVVTLSSNISSDERKQIEELKCLSLSYPVARNGLNPFKDIKTYLTLRKLIKANKPEKIFSYTIKPIIWGGIAARTHKQVQFYALVTGLGYAFQKGGFFRNALMGIVVWLYRLALRNSKAVLFQNPDNMRVFVEAEIVPKNKCYLVNGSGVNLKRFQVAPLPVEPKFLLIARLLGEKGIREYCQAAQIVKNKYPNASFMLVGPEDSSPDGIKIGEIEYWVNLGVIDYKGGTDDVRPYIGQSNIFVLPSYHEGIPRTVLEAMAMGRPILTTNVPGCRETVVNGENGWLVEKMDSKALAGRMEWFIENPDVLQAMGNRSHELAKEKFDVHKVNERILEIMDL